MKNILAAILTVACTVVAALISVQAFGQEPKALGWERGQSVPESAIVEQSYAQGPFKGDYVQPVAGLDRVFVIHTAKQGVCAVTGLHNFTSKDGYGYGMAHRSKVDEWADRVAAKFGGVAGEKWDVNFDGSAYYFYGWNKSLLPEGYSSVQVHAKSGYVVLLFQFDNYDACEAEREAAMRAEL